MFNFALIRTRLGQYGAAWLTSCVLVLLACLGGTWLTPTPLVEVVDLILPLGLAALTLAWAAVVVVTLLSGRETVATRLVIILLAVLMFLPLLWGPVLGAIGAAWVGGVSIEYSTAYAQFRILVSRALFDLAGLVFANPVLDTIWMLFQGLATIVGFLSAFFQVWPRILRLLGAREAAA
ncbi:MAG: hypothetical protein Q8L66_10250 [Caulobacter sp.]|nr:hypothetical protein [Caulobacter sp.]